MTKLYKINAIGKKLRELGLDISLDQVRKLERLELFESIRNTKNNYREYTEEQFNRAIKNIILYYFNTPVADIKSKDAELLAKRIGDIKKQIRLLS